MSAKATTFAASYCRSSKDKAEIGLDTQRKELQKYAQANDLRIVAEFSDMEISGSLDEVSRPGLRKLLAAMAAPDRKWSVLLAVDTSRIARDPMLALYVQRECEKQNVELRYSKVNVDGKDAVGEMLLSQLRAFDRFHSRLSAEKGRAGLETNIANGHRAGGRAPLGYKLQHTDTGATRGGMPVRKSKLVPEPRTTKKVQVYLRQRAEGVRRNVAAKMARLDKEDASLIALERNALTYAGYTVWNQRKKHKPTREDNRKTMLWRPRAEWVVSPKPTHEALITREEAERVLAGVDRENPKSHGFTARKPEQYLLTGLLFAPDGTAWQADGKFYRNGPKAKSKRILRAAADQLVVDRVASEIHSEPFVTKLVQAAHGMADAVEDRPAVLDKALRSVEASLRHVADAIAERGLEGSLRNKLDELEAERARIQEERATTADRAKLKGVLRAMTARDVAAMLEFGPSTPGIDVPYLRRTLGALVQRIDLDPAARTVQVHYRVGLSGAKLASPRGFEPLLPP